MHGISSNENLSWAVQDRDEITLAMEDRIANLRQWQRQMQQSTFVIDDVNDDSILNVTPHLTDASVLPFSDLLWGISKDGSKRVKINEDRTMDFTFGDVASLNKDQQRAYDIIDWHLQEKMIGRKPPQLLMMIPGEGGTGKSKLIQIITVNFDCRNVGEWCVKGMHTGMAALVIDGRTLHVLAGIPVRGGKQSGQTLKRLREFWRTKKYLIIDEILMLSRSFFAKLSQIISIAMESEDDRVFGGLNVILVGDFYQFPPVVGHQTAPLYWPVDQRRDTKDDILGRKIYEQFTMVVQLNKQNGVQDDIWQDVLQHVRHGNCHAEHVDIIRKLIIMNLKCPHTNYDSAPWKDAKLVTP
jgi:hypothetical protein